MEGQSPSHMASPLGSDTGLHSPLLAAASPSAVFGTLPAVTSAASNQPVTGTSSLPRPISPPKSTISKSSGSPRSSASPRSPRHSASPRQSGSPRQARQSPARSGSAASSAQSSPIQPSTSHSADGHNITLDSTDSDGDKSPTKEDRKRTLDDHDRQDGGEQEDEAMAAKRKLERHDEERVKMQVLVSNFSEEQLNRYEMYRRAAFPKAAIKRLMASITGSVPLSQNLVIAMAGISKVFVGEVVETALDVMEKRQETGPVQPKHLREAVRRMKQHGSIPTTKHKKRLF